MFIEKYLLLLTHLSHLFLTYSFSVLIFCHPLQYISRSTSLKFLKQYGMIKYWSYSLPLRPVLIHKILAWYLSRIMTCLTLSSSVKNHWVWPSLIQPFLCQWFSNVLESNSGVGSNLQPLRILSLETHGQFW